jgi:general secretion pathway protein I
MRTARGFTLLEVMVAFAIAALALAALTQAALGGLHATQAAAHTQQAISLAQSRLAAVALSPRTGEQSGTDGGGFAWHVSVRPRDVGGREQAGAGPHPVLYDIAVDVSWTLDGGTRRVTLDTLRLGTDGATGS